MALASLKAPALIVFVTAVPPPIHSTKGVPDTVKFVIVVVTQIVAVADPLRTILPVPKLSVLAFALLLENIAAVRVNVLKARVPAVNVYVPVVVRLVPSVKVPEVWVIGVVILTVVPPVLFNVGVPVRTVIPAALIVLLFASKVPLTNDN